MKKLTANEVIYETFAGMCKALKEKEGVMNKSIAIDMGIDFAIFSKLLGGKRMISDKYRDKIFNYFKAEIFASYADTLKLHICGALCLSHSSIAYKKIMAKSYPELLSYLFYQYNENDLTLEDDVRAMFIFYVKKFLGEILDVHSSNCCGYKMIVNEDTHELEAKLGLPENYAIAIGRFVDNQWADKIYILLCPQMWHKEREILRNPDVVELAELYMTVHLKDSFTENLFAIGGIKNLKGTVAEFETFHVGTLCRNARQLAEMIFNNVCKNIVSGENEIKTYE